MANKETISDLISNTCFPAGCIFANPETGKCEAYPDNPDLIPLNAIINDRCPYAAEQSPHSSTQLRAKVLNIPRKSLELPGIYLDRNSFTASLKLDVLYAIQSGQLIE